MLNKIELHDDALLQQWQEIVEIMAEIMQVPTAIITRINLPQIEILIANQHPESPYHAGQQVEIAGHYCEEVIKTRQRLHVVDARQSPRWQNAPELDHDMVSYMGYPLLQPDGEVFGTICVLDNKANTYSTQFSTLMRQFKVLVESHLLLLAQYQEIRTLRGFIPICARCKKVRNDEGYWEQVDAYIEAHSDALFTHGLCEDCVDEMYGKEAWFQHSKLRSRIADARQQQAPNADTE